MNYQQLFANVQTYLENQFPNVFLADGTSVNATTQINTFIQQSEQRIYNSVQFPSLRRNVTGFTTPNNQYLACPIDFLSVFSMAVIDTSGNYNYLLNKDVNFMREAYPNPTSTGIPKYYGLFGPSYYNSEELTFILGPTPDQLYNVELHYFFYPQSIVTANTTWLGDNFDTVLLYGTLVEAYTYMKGDADMIANYNQKYMEALQLAKRLGDGLERSDAYRSGQARLAPLPQNNGVK